MTATRFHSGTEQKKDNDMIELNAAEIVLHHREAFKKIFRLNLAHYMDRHSLFDVIKFDDWLKAGDLSIIEVVEEKFGKEAKELITNIVIGRKETPAEDKNKKLFEI